MAKKPLEVLTESMFYLLMARAREELRRLEVELPGSFLAWPGDLVEVDLARGTGRGTWRVAEMTCGMDERGTYTRLSLGEPEGLR